MTPTNNLYTVTMNKSGASWHYFTRNPLGGGGGSNYRGPKHIALTRALQDVPSGARYVVITNRKRGEVEVKP